MALSLTPNVPELIVEYDATGVRYYLGDVEITEQQAIEIACQATTKPPLSTD